MKKSIEAFAIDVKVGILCVAFVIFMWVFVFDIFAHADEQPAETHDEDVFWPPDMVPHPTPIDPPKPNDPPPMI